MTLSAPVEPPDPLDPAEPPELLCPEVVPEPEEPPELEPEPPVLPELLFEPELAGALPVGFDAQPARREIVASALTSEAGSEKRVTKRPMVTSVEVLESAQCAMRFAPTLTGRGALPQVRAEKAIVRGPDEPNIGPVARTRVRPRFCARYARAAVSA